MNFLDFLVLSVCFSDENCVCLPLFQPPQNQRSKTHETPKHLSSTTTTAQGSNLSSTFSNVTRQNHQESRWNGTISEGQVCLPTWISPKSPCLRYMPFGWTSGAILLYAWITGMLLSMWAPTCAKETWKTKISRPASTIMAGISDKHWDSQHQNIQFWTT